MKYIFIIFFLWSGVLLVDAQNTATVFGVIRDANTDEPLEFSNTYVVEISRGVECNEAGEYAITVPAGRALKVRFTRVGYKEGIYDIAPMAAGSKLQLDVKLASLISDKEVVITDVRIKGDGMIREDVKDLKLLPSTTGNLESVLPHIALGTYSGTGGELSSQYYVRGGNYDENLVYVNDFEIYRPQLIRAGQQEGLTFANIDLVKDLSFSSGGFEARYGDKLSSVLDIKYKRPDSTRASFGMSFLGGSAHIEGSRSVSKKGYRRFRYLAGARYKTTRYLLGSLDVKGEYTPSFSDIQTYLTYDLSNSWQIGLLGNYNRSQYNFIPTSRNTATGLIDYALQLYTVFEGQEADDFTTAMGGLSLTYLPDRKRNPFFLKFLASTYQSLENERFDIIGYYLLGQIETSLGSENAGQIVNVLGTGTQQQWVRNYLTSNVSNVEHKGGYELQVNHDNWNTTSSHFFQWGTKFQTERILDRINEWERLDSAGYSLPFDTTQLNVFHVLKTENELESYRLNGFFQDTYTFRKDSVAEIKASAGVRISHWSLNGETFFSPRAQIVYKPLNSSTDISFRLAGGYYLQPPFYRELRDLNGVVHRDVLSQKSSHIVGGMTWDFFMGRRTKIPFRLIMEAYYKKLWDLVTYDVDNVRVRYSGNNDASGYVTGLDLRLNGEFVPDAESWLNISILRAREKIDSITHLRREIGSPDAIEVSDVPRPTDQAVSVSVFFQDYLPQNKNFKMHLNLTLGTGLPFGLPNNNIVYRNTYRFQPYHRVDIGFSTLLWSRDKFENKPRHFLRFTRNTWLSLEVFNLLKVSNQASNTWIKTIYNTQYAIPNYLTSRRINLRLKVDL